MKQQLNNAIVHEFVGHHRLNKYTISPTDAQFHHLTRFIMHATLLIDALDWNTLTNVPVASFPFYLSILSFFHSFILSFFPSSFFWHQTNLSTV